MESVQVPLPTFSSVGTPHGLPHPGEAAVSHSAAVETADGIVVSSALPISLNSFVGRADEAMEVAALAGRTRLLTLTGPGGVGKTRLAAAVAFAVGTGGRTVRWAGLAALQHPDLVPQVVAAALGVAEEPGRPLLDSLFDRLRGQSLLLVCDCCEHVLGAVAELLETVMPSCEGLAVLATSREPLGVSGETCWPVPLLAVPDPGTPVADLPGVPAVALLVDRARAVRPGFTVGADNAAAVTALCRRLDGVPLAIELAAARLRLLSVEQIVARLDDGLRLLVAAGRGPDRHRSLQAVMDWSYELLSPAERALFARLSVFAGGFALDAAEQVAAGSDDPAVTLDLLSGLVTKSLVIVTEQGRQMRYRLLETVRQYAEDRLAPEEANAVRRRHARFFVGLAERAEPELCGSDQREWLDLLDAERDNLRAALTWSADSGWAEGALRQSAALWRFCYLRGHYREGRGWLRRALTASDGAAPILRARALAAAGTLAHLECDYDEATRDVRSALAVFRALEDRAGAAAALQALGSIARERADYPLARSLHEESLELSRHLDDDAGIGRALNYLGFLSWLERNYDAATSSCTAALAIFERVNDREGVAWCLLSLGVAEHYRGRDDAALPVLQRSLALSRELGYREGVAWSLNELGVLARHRGNYPEAAALLRDSLRQHRALGDRWRQASVLEELAAVAAGTGAAAPAVRLLAAAARLRETIGTPTPLVERPDVEDTRRRAVSALRPEQVAAAEADGRTLPVDELLGDPGGEPMPAAEPAPTSLRVAEPGLALLEVSALGAARVRLGDRLLGPADWGYVKPRELLYHLLDHPDRTKGQIGADLWPWASPAQLRNSFHATLHALRRALGRPDRVVYRQGRYAFNRSLDYRYDTERFESALVAARLGDDADVSRHLASAVAAYAGDYLVDVDGEAWIEVRRSALRQAYEAALLQLGRRQLAAGEIPAAIATFQRAIAYDRLLESAHHELIRCYARAGERGLALRQCRTAMDLMRDELGVPPGPEMTRLYDRLRRGEPL